ncbi:Spx/MgsR family transcriptional regulator [Alkalibacterium olivapovliticus]|nr:Spx/MgsR family transcriptional regulator [Alkalibacterium olivapovliticus]
MRLTEDGTEDIISKRSKVFKELNLDLDDLSMKELFEIIQNNPTLIRRPIILDDRRLQIGYNEDEIRQFVPREVRAMELEKAQKLVALSQV